MRRFFCFVLMFIGLSAAPLSAMMRRQSDPLPIGVRTFSFHDGERNRPVLVEIWYPVEGGETAEPPEHDLFIHPMELRGAALAETDSVYPLIVMSHGYRGDRRDRSWLAERLVREGYIVASVEHFGNSRTTFDPLLTLRYWDRTRDVTYALDRVLELDFLKEKVDANRIGFAGYSLGGMTGLSLAGCNPRDTQSLLEANRDLLSSLPPEALAAIDFSESLTPCRDPRFRALLLLAPANFLFPPESLKKVKVPVGMVSALNDEILPHSVHAYPIIQHLVPARLKLLRKNSSHFLFLNRVSEEGKKALPPHYSTDLLQRERVKAHREVGDFAAAFFRDFLF
jgi:predicted dienelactone hydrolase